MPRHRFHGAIDRFEVVAQFIYEYFGTDVRYIADVAGGQGMLSRLLAKRYGYDVEVVDPRGWTLRGIASRAEEYNVAMAGFYDLVVGLHPDEATRPIAESAIEKPTLIVPCCNFWDKERRLGRDALLDELVRYYERQAIPYERVALAFAGPKNLGVVTRAPVG